MKLLLKLLIQLIIILNDLKELNENLNEKYLNIEYYDIDNGSIFNIKERIKEINNYVSGEYSNNKNEICLINENWNTKKNGRRIYI